MYDVPSASIGPHQRMEDMARLLKTGGADYRYRESQEEYK
jgi:hypothetical protein